MDAIANIAIGTGGSLLSAALTKVTDEMKSSDLLKFARRENLEAEIRRWHKKLIIINAVLADAEHKQLHSEAVTLWLRNLKDLVYDLEDLLDEFSYESLRAKLTMSKSQASASKLQTLLPSCCLSLRPRFVFDNVKMGSKLNEITTRLEELVKEKNDLCLIENACSDFKGSAERLSTAPLVDISSVFGRESDKERIIEFLLSGEEPSAGLSVIPIVGMGGLGKTTLAQLAYNDDRVNAHFDLKAWVCVSDDFDVFKITRTIWQYVTLESCQFDDTGLLQQQLKEKLSGKTFLIVLDDVWNDNDDRWEALCSPFQTGVSGCKLLVTTRNDSVVSATGANASTFRLQQLSTVDCLALLEKQALGARSFAEFPDLKEIGKEICKKCGGIPLAVKTLGGILRNEQNPAEWEAILKSEIWDFPERKNGILPALGLSYHYLPAYLKCCFAYCSLFPKDYEFDKNELVSLWMAEGFLHQLKGKKEIQDLGCEYFDELLSRSFFQQSSTCETKYVMHDLMNDLAKFVAEQEKVYFSLDDEMKTCKEYSIHEQVRHSSFIASRYDVARRFNGFSSLHGLRTFLSLWKDEKRFWMMSHGYLSPDVVKNLLPRFKRLRSLALCHYAITVLPDSIGSMKHLRYLNLSYCHLTRLPDSVNALYSLQSLILYKCFQLVELPKGIENLIELYNLDVTDTFRLQHMPSGIGALTKLQALPKFIVSDQGDKLQLRELKNLTRLQGQLAIYGLEKVKEIQDVKTANLKGKERLHKLSFVWCDKFYISCTEDHEKQVLDWLEPSRFLKELEVRSYGGREFPAWLGGSMFHDMVKITLLYCKKCKSLPLLGSMPSLKHLHIEGMDEVETVGAEFSGCGETGFHNLETLILKKMSSWVEWTHGNAGNFPRLRELVVAYCPKLKGDLPSHLPSLEELEVSNCLQLKSLSTSLPLIATVNIRDCDERVLRSMGSLNSLTTMKLKNISGLCFLDEELMKCLATVVDLVISTCKELKCLWQNIEQSSGRHESGTYYGLKYLKRLRITKCGALEMLPEWLMQGSNRNQCVVEELRIEGCPLLRFLPGSNLPKTVKKLRISGCDNLECLPEGVMMHDVDIGNGNCHLEELDIVSCESLVSFPRGKFPVTLQKLQLWNCRQLDSVSGERFANNSRLEKISIRGFSNLMLPIGDGVGLLSSLTSLEFHDFPGLVSFPENIFLSSPNVKFLTIEGCKNLESLPNHMHRNLPSLQELSIYGCPSLSLLCFPPEEGRLPPSLIKIYISYCQTLKQPISELGLGTLTALTELTIEGPFSDGRSEMVSFPDNECSIVPTSLTSLSVGDFGTLESFSKGLLHLTSLQKLFVSDCPKIRSLPKQGLPDSLGHLSINNCPLLGERIIREKGEYWPCISHIPLIKISKRREVLTYTA